MSNRYFRTILLLAFIGIGSACGPAIVTDSAGVFPTSAQFGDTVAMVVDSNNIPQVDHVEKYDLSLDNTQVRFEVVSDPNCFEDITPRSVFDAGLSKSSERDGVKGAAITIAMIDIPTTALDTCAPAFPIDLVLKLVHEGVVDAGVVQGLLEITGDQGAPTLFRGFSEIPALGAGESLDERFAPKPGLRLRPLAGAGTLASPGFVFDWTVASIEFDLEYRDDKVSNPKAHSASDAHRGTAIVGPSTSLGGNLSVAHVVVMDPKGFKLQDPGPISSSGGAGDGPVVELTFDKLTSFDVADFAIENLVVTKKTGVIEVDLRDEVAPDGSAAYFNHHVVAHD